jgi:hypothetical protein
MNEGEDIGGANRVGDDEEYENEEDDAHCVTTGRQLPHSLVETGDLLVCHLGQALFHTLGIYTELGELAAHLITLKGHTQFTPQVACMTVEELVVADHTTLGCSERNQNQ